MKNYNKIFLFLIIFFTGCLDSQFKTISDLSSGEGGQSCPQNTSTKNNVEFVSVFQKENTKIFKSEFQVLSEKNIKIFQNSLILLKNTEVIVKANRACLLKKQFDFENTISNQIKTQVIPAQESIVGEFDYFVYTISQDQSYEDFEEQVMKDPCVLGVSPNTDLELQSLNDELYNIQNNMKVIKHDSMHSKILNEIQDEVLVAVVDSGNTQDHPDMTGRHWRNTIEENGQVGVDDDGNGFIDDIYGYSWACYTGGDKPTSYWWMPHGEHVAGTIAANMNNGEGVAGVAGQKAKIMHLNVIYSGHPAFPCSSGPQDLVLAIKAIKYAADNGAKVINLSMGKFDRNSNMEDVMFYAVSKGVFVASAAGNSNKLILDDNENFFYPCGYAKDIEGFSCVGAIDANPNANSARCSFSNYSTEYVELSAPGCDTTVGEKDFGLNGVLSTVRGTDTPTYKHMPGTSMATPHIAAAGAIVMGYLKSKRGSYPVPSEVEDILKKSSRLQANLASEFQEGRTLDLELLFQYMDEVVLGGGDNNPPIECP